MSNTVFYVDGPVSVVMAQNNVVRISFGLQKPENLGPNQEPEFDPTHEIAMPLDGMLRLIGLSQQVLEKFEESGLVQRSGDGPQPANAPVAPTPPPPKQ
ncbi:MAG: hypothetical protein ISN29_10115 [Gammaproteobacteria bacterium AqS3]|nr:hypothetical protein [Gammaproteobacteria bacterium AqS3]